MSKVIPESLDALAPSQEFARLQIPFYYWNALGLTAALGIGPCLWLGARREGHGVLNALAAPALTVLLVALVLSYSRGALLAAFVGAAVWFAFVPLRLRALAVAGDRRHPARRRCSPGRCASRRSPTTTSPWPRALRPATASGCCCSRRSSSPSPRHSRSASPPSATRCRRRGGARSRSRSRRCSRWSRWRASRRSRTALAASWRTISHGWHQLTSPNGSQPGNTAGRLTSGGSQQALYWSYAIKVFDTNPASGAGAGAYPVADQRFMTGPSLAVNAHSYVFQTLADLGIVGLALSLAARRAWCVAAVRAGGPFRPRAPGATSAERIGLLTMIAVVVIFAVHSAVDWTWFVPGDAVIALLCAGWVAGRGRPSDRLPAGGLSFARLARSPLAAATAALAIARRARARVVAAGNRCAPSRPTTPAIASRSATTRSSSRSPTSRPPSRATRSTSHPRPSSATPTLQAGRYRLAQQTFEGEVAQQPSNYASWLALFEFDSRYGSVLPRTDASIAKHALAEAIYLNPRSTPTTRTCCASTSRRSSHRAPREVARTLPVAGGHRVDDVVDHARADPLGRAQHALLAEAEPLRDRAAARVETPARISTRVSFQLPKAWSSSAATVSVIVPAPCWSAASQ